MCAVGNLFTLSYAALLVGWPRRMFRACIRIQASVCLGLVATAALWGAPAASAAVGPEAPSHLRCEYLTDPLGIDVVEPRFAWIPNHTQRGQAQTAYQVLVSNSAEALNHNRGDAWDSGKINSSDPIQVVYRGLALQSGRTYYWKV